MRERSGGAARLAALVGALAGLACGSSVAGPDGEGVLGEWVISLGERRTYTLRFPASFNDAEPTPLLIALHGQPDQGAAFESRTGLTGPASDAGFIVAYPDGKSGTWGPWDALFIPTLIDHLSEHLPIDEDRIYLAGYSAGGLATQDIICERSELFAAAAVVAATMDTQIREICRFAIPLPLLFVHGTEDTAFPWDGASSGDFRRFSVDETFDHWSQRNGCIDAETVDTLPDRFDDGTSVWRRARDVCSGRGAVVLLGIEGGGHTWPSAPGPFPPGRISREISSADILEFFALRPRS